jgi:hypothetical protein
LKVVAQRLSNNLKQPSNNFKQMLACQDYIERREGQQREIMQYLHDLLSTFPEITGRLNYGLPFYYRKRWVCYLNPTKDGQVELGFPRGWELSNEQGLLETKGRKQVRSVTFAKVEDIPAEALLEVIQEAILLE